MVRHLMGATPNGAMLAFVAWFSRIFSNFNSKKDPSFFVQQAECFQANVTLSKRDEAFKMDWS